MRPVWRLVFSKRSRICGHDGPRTKPGRPPSTKVNEMRCTDSGRRRWLVPESGEIKESEYMWAESKKTQENTQVDVACQFQGKSRPIRSDLGPMYGQKNDFSIGSPPRRRYCPTPPRHCSTGAL